jgi:hypothetical protein
LKCLRPEFNETMQRYYVRLNRQGQPSYLTRHDDPNHTPIAPDALPGRLRSLVVRVYGEFTSALEAPGAGHGLRGPVVIEWPEGAV